MTFTSSEIYNNMRKNTYTLEESIVIKKPINEVFDVATTSRTWANCYPETLSVGGVTKRPFKKGDLILEKFVFAGMIYCLFKYEVDEYDPPHHITFHGVQALTNDILDKLFHKLIAKIHGTFEYELTQIDKDTTKWVRKIHFYHSGGFFTKLFFKTYLHTILRSQKKGARMYVENVKWFLESNEYKSELYGLML